MTPHSQRAFPPPRILNRLSMLFHSTNDSRTSRPPSPHSNLLATPPGMNPSLQILRNVIPIIQFRQCWLDLQLRSRVQKTSRDFRSLCADCWPNNGGVRNQSDLINSTSSTTALLTDGGTIPERNWILSTIKNVVINKKTELSKKEAWHLIRNWSCCGATSLCTFTYDIN